MKKIYALFLILLVGNFGFGQGTENFNNLTTGTTNYATRTWTGQDGSGWTATFSRTDQTINANAITMNSNASAYVESGSIAGGLGDITITTQRKFTGGAGNLTVLVNGASVGTVPYSAAVQTTTISGVNVTGNIVIRVNNTSGADRVAVDDITWTASGGSSSNSIIIGTGTTLTAGTNGSDSDPIDGYFNSFRYQVVYTAAELSASLTANDEITALGWSIAGDYGGGNLLGYTIKMGHTTATNSAAHDASSTIVVKNAFNYNPTVTSAGVFDMIPFDTNFIWNGTDNVLVEVCSDGQNPFTAPYGQVRVTNIANGSRRYRVDGGSSCGVNTNTVNPNKPNIQFNYIDGTPPACQNISGLSVDNFTATSATISWTAGGTETEWEIAVQPDGTGVPIGAGSATTNNINYTDNTLSANTSYEVYVRANCGANGFSNWVGPVDFTTTIQGPVGVTCTIGSSTFVYTAEFDDFDGWTGDLSTATDGTWEIPGGSGSTGTGPDAPFSGSNFMVYEASGPGSGSTTTASAVSPGINLTTAIDAAELSFYMHAYGAGIGTLNVGVSISASGPFTTLFTQSGPIQTSGSQAWVPVGINLDAYIGQTIYIEFSHTGIGNFEGDMAIDFLRVESCGSFCTDPSSPVVTNITATSADFAWTAGGSETNWEIAVQPDGTGIPGAGTPVATDPLYTDNTLTELTAYEVYVRAECGFGSSNWVGPVDFTTPAACPDISGLTIDSFTASDVTVSWTAGGSETVWEIVVQEDGIGNPTTGAYVTNNPYTLGGLTGLTAYEVYVRADCTSEGNGFSDWVGPVDFTTSCGAIVPLYNADMSLNVPDACWDEAGSGEVAAGPGNLGASDWRQGTSYAFGPSNAINLFSNTDREWLLSPTFDLSAGGPFQLEVNVAVTDWQNGTVDDSMGSDDEVQLLISTDNGASWNNITTWNTGNEPVFTGTDYTADLTAYTGNVQFAIWASDGTIANSQDYDFHVGKFRVAAIPSNQTVDFCNLQSPSEGIIIETGNFDVYSRVYVDGFTQPAGSNPAIEAWIGVSQIDASSTSDFTSANWTWIPATFNNQFGNDDEYVAEIGSSLSGGVHYYVSRFRADGGPFAYGGIVPNSSGGNFWDGTNFVSGQLTVQPAPPTTVATLNLNGCADSDTYSGAYDANVEGIVWVELIYDGGCSEITIDNETTTGFTDSEIGLYDALGNLVGSDDDSGTGSLGLFTQQSLPAGTYYIASGAYNITFGATDFNATTSSTTATGNIVINASTPNAPDFVNLQFPGTATINVGNSETVYAQIFEAGNTQGAGPGTNITAEIGISLVDATTTADFMSADWTWTTAPYFGESGNNDEYALAIGASLDPGTYYYVSRFTVDGGPFAYGGSDISDGDGGNFWDGTTYVSGVLTVSPRPEPTNHATAFTAVADSDSQITLTWNDNDGAQPADRFLIVGKTGTASFYMPVDGTEPAEDTDWSDDEFEVIEGSGVQTYTVTGLLTNTLYEFQIYPFTNSGSLADFKTDGTIPSTSATTLVDPCSVAITAFPFEEDFEGNGDAIPNCWTQEYEVDTVDWRFNSDGDNGGAGTSNDAFSGTRNALFVDSSAADDITKLVSPALDLSGLATPTLTFWHTQELWVSDQDELRIYYKTSAAGAWILIPGAEYTNSIPDWTQETIVLPNPSADYYIAFEGNAKFGRGVALDDVKVEDVAPTTYTYIDGTWSPSDPNGTATANDDIIVASGDATINTNTTANTVTVNPGASITVDSAVTLTVADATNGLTLESISTSYSSLILNGTISGTLNYERHVNINGSGTTGSNDLISAPLTGQAFNDFVLANPNLFGNGTLSLFGHFDKPTGAYVTYANTSTVTLDPAVGYRAASSDNSTLTFTGTASSGPESAAIVNSGPSFQKWNLVGNPYPSYMNVQAFLNHTVDTGVTNLDLFDSSAASIYGYDGFASDGWVLYNLASTTATTTIAPGQGFFVTADATNAPLYDLEFTPAMRATASGNPADDDDFIPNRNAELVYLKLNASTANNSYRTDFYFNPNASLGMDFGYDGQIWGGTAPSFAIYSHLVEDNMGEAMALQALNSVDLSNVTIPLGVNSNQGQQITFSIQDSTLPESIAIYLDDVVANTSTLLNTSNYVFTPNTALSGTGRFFLRYSEAALSTLENNLNTIIIFTTKSPNLLHINGELKGKTNAKIYDLQGRLILETPLDNTQVSNKIDVSDFSNGVYLVTVSNGIQTKSQKVIIR